MARHQFPHDGLTFSYLDSGGHGPVLLLLHGHFMGASDFDDVIRHFTDTWRVVALDQRGHGQTSHTTRHSTEAYINDVAALLDHLHIDTPIVVLGHSWGGEVAYLFAAAYPERVRAMIIEEMDVVRDDDNRFVLDWAGVYPTRQALEAKLPPHLVPYLQKSIHQVGDGWSLTFEPEEYLLSEKACNGDHWAQWLASTCPALILRGTKSPLVPGEALEEMARRRPNTKLVSIEAGHSVHIDAPEAFVSEVHAFLDALPAQRVHELSR